MEFGVVAFWLLARIGFVYLPAIVAALAMPSSVRWAVFLAVAAVAQGLAFGLESRAEGQVTLLAWPATVLLTVGAATSLWSWHTFRRRSQSAA